MNMAKMNPAFDGYYRGGAVVRAPDSSRAWFDLDDEQDPEQLLALRQAERRRKRLLPVVGTLVIATGGFLIYALASSGHVTQHACPDLA